MPFTFAQLKRHLADAARETLDFEEAGAFDLARVRARDVAWLLGLVRAVRARAAQSEAL